jgi:thiol-disulfide isomerase/thioredoxin
MSREDREDAVPDGHPPVLGPRELGLPEGTRLGARATVVQVSSAFCAPCRAARTVAARVAATTEDVLHVEVDVAGHEALAAALQITATPTVLVLDPAGRLRRRLEGVPRLAWLREAVADL